MARIHFVQEKTVQRHVIDPDLGLSVRNEKVVKASDINSVTHDGVTYEPDDTGTFEVSDEAAAHLCAHHRGCYLGDNPFHETEDEQPKRAPRPRKSE